MIFLVFFGGTPASKLVSTQGTGICIFLPTGWWVPLTPKHCESWWCRFWVPRPPPVLAAIISISCAFVQRPATNDLHILFSIVVSSHFLLDLSRLFRCLGEGGRGVGDAWLVFVSSKTCIIKGFWSFRALLELILRFGAFEPQKTAFPVKNVF